MSAFGAAGLVQLHGTGLALDVQHVASGAVFDVVTRLTALMAPLKSKKK